ncbi:hypothetical protein PROFUN_03736 [Planoprotostelium fungivorum]|uniref:Trafficking protein particle complex subunit 10 n=1 Tax=Planoprotostelium fungivorum TaxID=1890364 RepID=A0A2P6NDK1_9EUKA|nr:hypothetical protein PROFUN_03736 [Planoprotostelium fungivorum]
MSEPNSSADSFTPNVGYTVSSVTGQTAAERPSGIGTPRQRLPSGATDLLVDSYETKNDSVTIGYAEETPGLWATLERAGLLQLGPLTKPWIPRSPLQFNEAPPGSVRLSFVPAEKTFTSMTPMSWYLRPSACLLFVQCEDAPDPKILGDKIREWTNDMNNKRLEWLIVDICISQKTTRSEIASKLVGTTYNKIIKGYPKERCCQVRVTEKNDQKWEELLVRLRECVLASFDAALQIQGECKRLMDSRLKPNWSFYDLFLLKEGLAFTYERVGMLNEASRQYHELDVALSEQRGTRNRFAQFGADEPSDEDGKLFDLKRKNFRSLIFDQKLSEFDLQQLIFARQAQLLMDRGSPGRAARRAMEFFQKMNSLFSHAAKPLSPSFVDAWTLNCALQIANQCEEKLNEMSKNNTKPVPDREAEEPSNESNAATEEEKNLEAETARRLAVMHYLVGDLYHTAARKLLRLGRMHGRLPRDDLVQYRSKTYREGKEAPAAFTAEEGIEGPRSASVREMLSSNAKFDKCYTEICQKAIQHYEQPTTDASRLRSILKVKEDLATLDVLRGRYERGGEGLEKIYKEYEKEGWHALSLNVLDKASTAYQLLQNKEKYLSIIVEKLSRDLQYHTTQEQKQFYMDEIFSLSTEPLSVNNCDPILHHSITMQTNKEFVLTSGTTLSLPCHLYSNFPKEVKLDRVFIVLTLKAALEQRLPTIRDSSNKEVDHVDTSIRLSVANVTLQPDRVHHLTFEEEVIHHGIYVLESFNVQIGKLILTESIKGEHAGFTFKVVPSKPTAHIEVKGSGGVLIWNNVQLLHVLVHTGEDTVQFGSVRVSNQQSNVQVQFPESDFIDIRVLNREGIADNQTQVQCHNGRDVPLPSPLLAGQTAEFFVPILGQYQVGQAERASTIVQLDLSYRKHTKETFLISHKLPVDFGFPFEIDYHIVALEKTMYLQILLQSTISSATRLKQYALTVPASFSVENEFKRKEDIVIEERQLASLLFQLEQKKASQDTSQTLELSTNYCMVDPNQHPLLLNSPLKSDYSFRKTFQVDIPKLSYHVQLNFPEETTVGAFLPLEFEISCIFSLCQGLRYEVVVDSSVWMLSGKKILSFQLKEGEKTSFSCRLLPLTSGFLPVPKVVLYNDVDGERIHDYKTFTANAHVQCRVGSPQTFVSALVEAVLPPS